MQNFTLFTFPPSVLVACFLACIIVIVPNVASIFTAQPNEFLVRGVEQARQYIISMKLSSARIFGASSSKVAPYKLREYV